MASLIVYIYIMFLDHHYHFAVTISMHIMFSLLLYFLNVGTWGPVSGSSRIMLARCRADPIVCETETMMRMQGASLYPISSTIQRFPDTLIQNGPNSKGNETTIDRLLVIILL